MTADAHGHEPDRTHRAQDVENDVEDIVLSDVAVDFPNRSGDLRRVLDGISLHVPRGQFLALVGKSGCGKTTLLNMIAALVEPTAGTIQVAGTTPRAARPHLGFMLARDALLPWRTAIKNVEYGLELRGLGRKERHRIAHTWLQAVHLGEAEQLWPWQLSQGMRQRVALARTWALDPDILLMDEPFAALDATTRIAVQQEFLALWQTGRHKTVIFVTHDLAEAITLADRVVLLGEGQVLQDLEVTIQRPRDLDAVATHPRYQEIYQSIRTAL